MLVGLAAVAGAVLWSAGHAAGQAVTRAYTTDTALQRGMIVRLDDKDKSKVLPLKSDDITHMEGVVVAANDAPVTISSSDPSKQQVFVATSGRYHVLVSNQNGPIKTGGHVTISSLAGIGTAASSKEELVIGKALADFDGKSGVSGTAKLKNQDGIEVAVALGLLPVDINISHNPLKARDQKAPQIILGFLQSAALAIVKKPVDPARLYLGALVFVLTAVVAGSILYSGVRNSLISIGRNPLAKKSIVGNLIQIVIISVIVLIIGILGVYLILKL